jgi:predicted PurR-regulated permease PerM
MFTLVNILIIFFLFLIIYQIILANNIREGLSSSDDDVATLVHKNAAEIQIINEHLLDPVNLQIATINTNITNLQEQVNNLSIQLQEQAQNMPGVAPVTTTSTTSTASL